MDRRVYDTAIEQLKVEGIGGGGITETGEMFIDLKVGDRIVSLVMEPELGHAVITGLFMSKQDAQKSGGGGFVSAPVDKVEIGIAKGGHETRLGMALKVAGGGSLGFAISPEHGPKMVDQILSSLDSLGMLPSTFPEDTEDD